MMIQAVVVYTCNHIDIYTTTRAHKKNNCNNCYMYKKLYLNKRSYKNIRYITSKS